MNGWQDYVYWQTEDRKTLKKIHVLIADICRNGNEGIGKPEPLSENQKTLVEHRYENNCYFLFLMLECIEDFGKSNLLLRKVCFSKQEVLTRWKLISRNLLILW